MITSRINEIVASPKKIEVLYNNKPVWLETVEENSRLAKVKVLGENREIEVPIADLKEGSHNLS